MSLAKTEWAMHLFIQDRQNKLPRGTRLSVMIRPLKESVFDLGKVGAFNAAFAQSVARRFGEGNHFCTVLDPEEMEQKRKRFLASIESQMAGN